MGTTVPNCCSPPSLKLGCLDSADLGDVSTLQLSVGGGGTLQCRLAGSQHRDAATRCVTEARPSGAGQVRPPLHKHPRFYWGPLKTSRTSFAGISKLSCLLPIESKHSLPGNFLFQGLFCCTARSAAVELPSFDWSCAKQNCACRWPQHSWCTSHLGCCCC